MFRHLLAGAATVVCGLSLAVTASATDGELGSALYTGPGYFSVLFTGQQLVSDSGFYRLVMQGDGNLVEYGGCGSAAGNVRWANNEVGGGRSNGGIYAAWAELQNDGNFVEYSGVANLGAFWATGTNTGNGNYLWMQDDGNVVVYESNGGHWATGTHGAEADPHCNEASFTTVYSNWAPAPVGAGGTYIENAVINFGQCGNACALMPDCVGFWSYSDEFSCDLFSAMPTSFTQTNASGDYLAFVTRATPEGN